MGSKMSVLWRLSIWNTAGKPTIQEVSIQGSSAIKKKNSWRWFSDPNAKLTFTVHSCNIAMSLYCIKIRSVVFTWHCPLLVVKVQQIMSTGHILSHYGGGLGTRIPTPCPHRCSCTWRIALRAHLLDYCSLFMIVLCFTALVNSEGYYNCIMLLN